MHQLKMHKTRPAQGRAVQGPGILVPLLPSRPLPFKHTSTSHGSVKRSSRSVVIQASILDTLLKPVTSAGQIGDLKKGIATFYDESSGLWEEMWGEHMHHGKFLAVKAILSILHPCGRARNSNVASSAIHSQLNLAVPHCRT